MNNTNNKKLCAPNSSRIKILNIPHSGIRHQAIYNNEISELFSNFFVIRTNNKKKKFKRNGRMNIILGQNVEDKTRTKIHREKHCAREIQTIIGRRNIFMDVTWSKCTIPMRLKYSLAINSFDSHHQVLLLLLSRIEGTHENFKLGRTDRTQSNKNGVYNSFSSNSNIVCCADPIRKITSIDMHFKMKRWTWNNYNIDFNFSVPFNNNKKKQQKWAQNPTFNDEELRVRPSASSQFGSNTKKKKNTRQYITTNAAGMLFKWLSIDRHFFFLLRFFHIFVWNSPKICRAKNNKKKASQKNKQMQQGFRVIWNIACVCLDTKNERVDLAARIPRTFIKLVEWMACLRVTSIRTKKVYAIEPEVRNIGLPNTLQWTTIIPNKIVITTKSKMNGWHLNLSYRSSCSGFLCINLIITRVLHSQ